MSFRRRLTIDNYNGTDTATQNTQSVFAYDADDRLEGVGDPDGLNTTYSYDGLGNATGVQSPDTGGTSYVYDAAGNVTQRTDARGVVSHSTYDALNRRTAATYTDGTLNVAYGYDEANSVTGCAASYPTGRLTRIVETAVTTVYCYDAHGNVTRKSQTQGTVTDTTAYSYTLADRLASTLTPAGTSIQYSHDAAGRISGVTALPPGTSGAGAGNVVTNVSYLPFGPIASYTLGNGQTITRAYNANYALTDVVSPALNLHFARDAMGNITALGNAPGANPATETYSYDPLYRLTGLTDGSGNVEEAYTYSKTGDRLSKIASGLATGVYTYQSGTHHLASIGNASRAYDANGNTTGSVIGGDTFGFGYNGRNRMTIAQRDGSTVGTYTYNALGQRTAKIVTFPAAGSQRFAYNEANQLLGEYGNSSRDYIWLDDLPVATLDTVSGTSTVSYVHSDGASTPRAVTDATGASIWQLAYQGNPFGEHQPSSASGYFYNLRFSGQYYDVETGLNYNIHRYYESATGRYIQSDPIGLHGGTSTYGYVKGSPLNRIDPLGTDDTACMINSANCGGPGTQPQSFDSFLFQLLFNTDIDHVNPPGDDSIQSVEMPMEFMAADGLARAPGMVSRLVCPGLGDLTRGEVRAIQSVVNRAGRPLDVPGSAARGARRGVGSDLPLGKGPGTRSDIDYATHPANLPYFKGLEGDLPSIDPNMGIIPGVGNSFDGPYIRFLPGEQPTFFPRTE